jgi:hypothetical protein
VHALPLLLALALAAEPPGQALRGEFLYTLSTFTGPVRSDWANVAFDLGPEEIYAAHGGTVGIFNRLGMQVHEFGGEGILGSVLAAAPMPDGDILVLSMQDGRRAVTRCDFRGEPLAPFEPKGLTEELAKTFSPDQLHFQGGKVYLGDTGRMVVVVADLEGNVLATHDLKKILKLSDKELDSATIRGMGVDRDGRILLTLPLLFRVSLVSPDQSVRSFGTRGSTPGRFNIIGKMTSDEKGYYFLTDTLRCVVMVFDPDLKFLGEFGYRGDDVDNLITPLDIAAGNGKVFVSQAGSRGVSVFRVKLPPPEPAAPPESVGTPAASAPPPTSAPATPPAKAAPR